jgi:ABC-type polar amino acid transport system ATPase subunit
MSGTEKPHAVLLDELAALDPAQRREVAKELRKVAETFAEVPDGKHTAHTLRLLAHFLDPL